MPNTGRKYKQKKDWSYKRHTYGSALTFIEDRELWSELSTAGVSLQAFRAWLKSMSVPVVHVGKKRLVRLQAFKTAILAVSSVGQPDYLVPGCELLKVAPKWLKDHPGYTRTLDLNYFRKHFSDFVEELLLSRATSGSKLSQEVVEVANQLIDSYIQQAVHYAPLHQLHLERDSRRRSKKNLIGSNIDDLKRAAYRRPNSGEVHQGPGSEPGPK